MSGTSECSAAESNNHLILTDLLEKRHWKRTHWLIVDEAIFSVIGSFQCVSYTRRLQPAHLVSCIIRGGTANINFVHNNRA